MSRPTDFPAVGAPALVDVAELEALLRPDTVYRPVVLDLRWELNRPSKLPDYRQAHLPGAVFVDLEAAFSGPRGPGGSGGRHPMPSTDQVEQAMRRAGVDDDSLVVCYDGGDLLAAARAWWVLRYLGAASVRVLDGGFAAWVAAGLPVASGDVRPDEPGSFKARPGSRRLLTAADVPAYAARRRLLDARAAGRYAGLRETIDPVAGHIPGALSAPGAARLDRSGRMRPRADLLAQFAEQGIAPGDDVAVYCGSGISACTVALALAAAGVTDDAAVYVGSWSDWISDRTRPVATGDKP
jgi:thiosulfate/3-mercaptopyruvate sulfurtransferase